MMDFKVGDRVNLLPGTKSYMANTLLAASHKTIDELRGDLDRANTLVGALEKLLSSERDVSRADRLLHTYKSDLHQAEAEYRKARDSFDRASSESDTNGGESSSCASWRPREPSTR